MPFTSEWLEQLAGKLARLYAAHTRAHFSSVLPEAVPTLDKRSKLDAAQDIVFAGQCKVVLINGRRDFVTQAEGDSGSATYLAGSYADAVPPAQVDSDRAAGLYGQFVLVRHDSQARTLTVLTDRFSLFPLFMGQGEAHDTPRLYLATNFSALAARCSAADSPDQRACCT